MLQRRILLLFVRRIGNSWSQCRSAIMAPANPNHHEVAQLNNDDDETDQLRSKKSKHCPNPVDPFPRPPSPEVPLFRSSAADVPQLRVKRLTDDARLPTRASANAAGLDLYCSQSVLIPSGQRALVKTDLQIAVPEGCYGRVAPRSGLALKHGLDIGAGVVDADYRGPLGVVVFNLSDQDFHVSVGDRIAQLILEKIEMPEVVECPGGLNETQRGEGAFGSTGGFGLASGKPEALSLRENFVAGLLQIIGNVPIRDGSSIELLVCSRELVLVTLT